jgi:hypothetical protein
MSDDIHIKDYGTGNQPEGQTWDTEQLQKDFEVMGFGAPYVAVRRKSDGVVGTLEFTHQPRLYFGFKPHEPV